MQLIAACQHIADQRARFAAKSVSAGLAWPCSENISRAHPKAETYQKDRDQRNLARNATSSRQVCVSAAAKLLRYAAAVIRNAGAKLAMQRQQQNLPRATSRNNPDQGCISSPAESICASRR